MAFRWGLLIPGLILGCFLSSFPSLSWRDMNTVFTVGREHTVKSGEIDPRLGHKGSQTRNKIHRFKNYMRGAIAVRCFQFVAHLAGGSE